MAHGERMSAARLRELEEDLPVALLPADVQAELLDALRAEKAETRRLRRALERERTAHETTRDRLRSFGGVR